MKKLIYIALLSLLIVSCKTQFNEVYKTTDVEYKYEAAKEYYLAGQYNRCYQILEDLVFQFKATDKGEESLYMLGMCYYNMGDYETASLYLDRYYKTYPKGIYTEYARYYSARANYMMSPDTRLDQSPTVTAINALVDFQDVYPYSVLMDDAVKMTEELRDRLALKEYQSAQLYYNLGSYTGNCMNGGSNYEACIITAENALKSYPFTTLREDFYIMILRARYRLANKSVEDKKEERYRNCIDEYYGFKNEFPNSKYTREADNIFRHASARQEVKDKELN